MAGSKSVGNLARTTGSPTSALASRPSGSPLPGPPPMTRESAQEFKRMLEETRKEVREIKSVEAQMKWNLKRDEKKEKILEVKADEDEIRDWRWKQHDEMKEYVAEKEQETRATDLQASKEFQEFKREKRIVTKEDEIRFNAEVYQQDLEHAQWRNDMARMVAERDREALADHVEDVVHFREVKTQQKAQEMADEEENRMLEQNLEMMKQARELAMQKEQLLASLDYTRAAHATLQSSGTGRNSTARSSYSARGGPRQG